MAELHSLHEDDTLRIASCRNLIMAAWTEAPSEDQLILLGRLGREFAGQHAGGTAFINLMKKGRPSFDAAVRKRAEELSRDASVFPLGSAHVVMASGFTSTAVHAFLSTVFLVARPPKPTKAFRTLDTALPWVLERLNAGPVAWQLEELEGAVAQHLGGGAE